MTDALTIGQVAQAVGVAARTIRYYEAIGVLSCPRRSATGYRQYTQQDRERLLFVRRARAIGLSLENIRGLTAALSDGSRAVVRPRLAMLIRAQLVSVRQRIAESRSLERQLEKILQHLLGPSPAHRGESCRCLEGVAIPPRLDGKRNLTRRRRPRGGERTPKASR